MKLENISPIPQSKVTFKLASFKSVPKKSGCYILTTFDTDILYIGLSDNLYVRFQQHLNSLEKTKPTKEGKAVWFYFTSYDPNNLPKLERTWIAQFQAMHGQLPVLNKISSPIS